jgi:hypothetical protein
MANQTITQYHHFFNERRDIRRHAQEFFNFFITQHPRNQTEREELLRLYTLNAGQLLFWMISLTEDEQRQNNPFAQERMAP